MINPGNPSIYVHRVKGSREDVGLSLSHRDDIVGISDKNGFYANVYGHCIVILVLEAHPAVLRAVVYSVKPEQVLRTRPYQSRYARTR